MMKKLMAVIIGLSMFLALSTEGICESFWTDYYSATEEYVRLNNLELEGVRTSEKLSTSKELWNAYDRWGYLKDKVKKLRFSDKDIENVRESRFSYAKNWADGINWDDKETVKRTAKMWGTPENKKGFIEKIASDEMRKISENLKECVEYLENAIKLRRKSNKLARDGKLGVSWAHKYTAGDMYFVASLLKAKEVYQDSGYPPESIKFGYNVDSHIKYFLTEKNRKVLED